LLLSRLPQQLTSISTSSHMSQCPALFAITTHETTALLQRVHHTAEHARQHNSQCTVSVINTLSFERCPPPTVDIEQTYRTSRCLDLPNTYCPHINTAVLNSTMHHGADVSYTPQRTHRSTHCIGVTSTQQVQPALACTAPRADTHTVG